LINALLAKIGIQGPDWLGNPNTALFAIIVLSIWQACGMHMVIWLSGLQTIPGELYEAADLDGATKFQQFLHVTWPGLRATRTFILITITIAAFSLFAQVNIMTDGGPLDATTTLVFQAVRVGFEQQQTGYASAISLVFFILVLIVTMINRYLTRDKDVR
jgi:multiple sugar transport system permease protein